LIIFQKKTRIKNKITIVVSSKTTITRITKTIIVDITVAECQIRAAKPADPFQSDAMSHGDVEKAIWWNDQLVDLAGRWCSIGYEGLGLILFR
jgi:hypothetical protein